MRQGHEAELVYDEQLQPEQLLLQVQQALLVSGFHKLIHQTGSRGEADGESSLTGGESQSQGYVGLAGTAVAYGDDVLAAFYVLAAGELGHKPAVHRRHGLEVEGVQALHRRKAGGLDPAPHHAVMAVYELKLRQPQQVVGIVHPFGSALGRNLAELSQEGRQLQLLQVVLQQKR